MAARCGRCGSSMVQAALDRVVCLICGAPTTFDEMAQQESERAAGASTGKRK